MTNYRTMVLALGLACALLVPCVLADFQVFQLTQLVIYAIALLGLNLVAGYAGQLSIGHGAFFALGAYCAVLLVERLHVPHVMTIPVAALLCFIAGYLFGFPMLRLEGLHLALATLALAVAVPQILKYFDSWSGGFEGLVIDKPKAPFGWALSSDKWTYVVALLIACLLFWLARNLVTGRMGQAIVAGRDHPMAAAAMGVDLTRVKTVTFGISAAFTGVAGALSALAVAYIAPDSFTLMLSIYMLVGVVVGGNATITGPIYGAMFIFFVPTLAQHVSKAAPSIVFGIALFVVIYVMPGGIAGGLRTWADWWQRRLRARRGHGGHTHPPA